MFGKSLFQSVLERIEEENPRDEIEVATRAGISGLNTGLAFSWEPAAAGDAVRQAYADMEEAPSPTPEPEPRPEIPEPRAPEPPPRERPAHLDRLSPAEVAEDLEISNADTPTTLAEKRRAFAIRNHPDRHAPEDSAAATTRMTLGNMLVDEALRRLKRGLPIGMTAPRPR